MVSWSLTKGKGIRNMECGKPEIDVQVIKDIYIKKSKWDNKNKEGSISYHIVGALGNKRGLVKGSLVYEDGRKLIYYEVPENNRYYRIKGYKQINEETYVVVLKLRVAEWIGLLVGLVGFILLIILLMGSFKTNEKVANIDKDSDKYTPDIKISEQIDPSKIILPGYKDIRIQAGTNTAYIALWNPDTNPCYFQFIIMEKDSGEVIYKSGLIPPGEAVTKVKFKHRISQGIHEALMTIRTYDLKNHEQEMNGGNVKIRIIGMEK